MNVQISPRLAAFLTLLLISAIGTLLILRATPEGMGLSDDSIAYIAGARSMLAGDGYREAWLASNGPVTHFPPGFSSVLAFFGLFGLDPLRGARLVNALLFGMSTMLMGILVWRMTPSLTAGLVAAALFVASGEMLQVYAVAMSEPLYIFFSLLAFWMFDIYFERPPSRFGWEGSVRGRWWLIFCAIFTGLAYLTRYAGLSLAATFVIALFVIYPAWRDRFGNSLIFLAGFVPFVFGWAIRNRLVADNATNRAFSWHPITEENITIGLRTFSDFFIPLESVRKIIFKQPIIIEIMIVIVLGVVLVWTVRRAWQYISKPRQESDLKRGGKESREVISFTNGLYIFAYLASISASMLMFDAATKFKLRILAPVFVSLLILLVAFGIYLRNKNRILAIVAIVVLLGLSIYKQSVTFAHWSQGGMGYASFQWYDSQAMTYLRDLPEDVKIYTNEPGAVYLYTGRGAYVLPSRYDSATAEVRQEFEESVAALHDDIERGAAVMVLFDGGDNIPKDVDSLIEGLHLDFKAQGDSIYAAEP